MFASTPAVGLDLVVEGAEGRGNGPLFLDGWQRDRKRQDVALGDRLASPARRVPEHVVLHGRQRQPLLQEDWIYPAIASHDRDVLIHSCWKNRVWHEARPKDRVTSDVEENVFRIDGHTAKLMGRIVVQKNESPERNSWS